MATLTVWKFDAPDGAAQALGTLRELVKQQLIQVEDAALVSWPADAKKPKTKNLGKLTGEGAVWGAFWGLLFGMIFLVPVLGLAIGAGMGALFGSMADVGISDDFIKQVREKVTPGTSALFLLTSNAVQERVAEAMKGYHMELISSNLTAEQEQQLRAAFADTEEADEAQQQQQQQQ